MAKYMSFCKNCRGWLLTDDDFCPKCGGDLIESDISAGEWKQFTAEDKQDVTEEFLGLKTKKNKKEKVAKVAKDEVPHRMPVDFENEGASAPMGMICAAVGAVGAAGGVIGGIMTMISSNVGAGIALTFLSVSVGTGLVAMKSVLDKQDELLQKCGGQVGGNVATSSVVQQSVVKSVAPAKQSGGFDRTKRPAKPVRPMAREEQLARSVQALQEEELAMENPSQNIMPDSVALISDEVNRALEAGRMAQPVMQPVAQPVELPVTQPVAQAVAPVQPAEKSVTTMAEQPVVKQVPKVDVFGEMVEYGDEIVMNCNSLNSATEILQYLQYLASEHDDGGLDELIKFIGKYANAEETRGNLKPQAVKIVAASFKVVL